MSPPLEIRVARSPLARLTGLAGRRRDAVGHALHLRPCRSVHTAGMRFALDLVWLDGDGAVVRVDRDVAPLRMRSCATARSVVEVAAGGAEAVLAALAAGC